MRFLALTALLLAGCSGISRMPSSRDLPWGLASGELPEPNAVIRWSDPHYEDASAPALDSLGHVEVPQACHDRKLYPTHPQQFSKIYHVFRMSVYDTAKIPPASRVCKITSRGETKFCLMADTFEYAVISDIFQDACGGFYRGIWTIGFLKQDDTMGALLSRGRTIYPKEGADFAGDMEEGQTYPLDRGDFLFLTPLFPGDKEKAEKLAQEALLSHTYSPGTHLFEKRR